MRQRLSSEAVLEAVEHHSPACCGPLQVLGDALAAAEGVGGEAHPRVACVLLELGRLYARTARVGLAEGLYRCRHFPVQAQTLSLTVPHMEQRAK